MTTPSEKKAVLLVDDSSEFLSSASEVLEALSEGAWEISTCASGGDAMAALQRSPIDLVALDVNMPVLDGVQLLGLLQRRFPAVLKVVLTGEASAEQRAACLTAGAELVLDKPVGQDSWRSLYTALNTLLQAPKEEGFRGVLRKVSLPDVIQMECLAANSSVLEITGAGMRGRLYIKEGQIIHGKIGDLTGVEALNNMLCLPGGSFHLLPFTDPGKETISGQWEFLLMEAARIRDETTDSQTNANAGFNPETLPDAAAIEAFSIAPSVAKMASESTETAGEAKAIESSPSASQAASPTVAPGPAPPQKPADTTTGMQPVIKETLICSLDGEVLYEWNVVDPGNRVSLLEFITKRSSTMGNGLSLGAFERFESVDKGVRCVAKLDGNQALLVRVQSVLAGGAGASGTP